MKVIIVSGNPWEQPQLVKKLAKELTETGQIVHVHDAMINVFHIVSHCVSSDQLAFKRFERGSTKVVNGNIAVSLHEFFGCSVLGHNFGYDIQWFAGARALVDEFAILSFKSGINTGIYKAIVSNIKDIKYVDCLLIYNVLDVSSMGAALLDLKRSYGSELQYNWLNIEDADEKSSYKDIKIPTTIETSGPSNKGTKESLISLVPSIISGKTAQKEELQPEKGLSLNDLREYLGTANNPVRDAYSYTVMDFGVSVEEPVIH